MANQAKRPTKDEVFAKLQQRRATLGRLHVNMNHADRWIHADEDPAGIIDEVHKGFDDDHDWVIYPDAKIVLNRGVNQMSSSAVPQVIYELPQKMKKDHPNWADDEKATQTALQGILHQIVSTSTENPFQDLLMQQLGCGIGVLTYPRRYDDLPAPEHGRGTPEEREAWDRYEEACAERPKWNVSSQHPTWLFFDTHHDPPEDYILEIPVAPADMAERFPELGLSEQVTNGDTDGGMLLVEYVSANFYGCWVDEEPVTKYLNMDADEDGIAPNTLAHPWVGHCLAGMGKKDKTGRWERRAVGIINQGIPLFKKLTRARNRLDLIEGSYVPKYLAQAETREQAAEETADIDPNSPAVAALSKDVSFKQMETPAIPPALLENLRSGHQELEQMYGPDLLSGAYHDEPASKQASRLEQARGPYRTPKKNAEQLIATMLGHMLMDMKYEGEFANGYTVAWETERTLTKPRQRHTASLKREQIHLGGKISIDLSPMTPEEEAFATEDAIHKKEAGLISQERAMKEGAKIDNVEEELAHIAVDLVWQGEANIAFQTELYIQRQRQKFGIPDPMMMAQQAQMGGMGAPPAQGAMPAQSQAPLPVGVPQAPPPPLGGQMEAQQRAEAAFAPPPGLMAMAGAAGY